MTKFIAKIAGATAVAMLFAAQPFVFAQSTSTPNPLTASCSGSVSQNAITWSANVSGGVLPYGYLWSGAVSGTSSMVAATYNATGTYQASVAVTDSATTTLSASCSATVTSLPQATTTTHLPKPFFKEPMLNINPAGHFLARGMKIKSVASTSFVGEVWGTTWTVNVRECPEFLSREGRPFPDKCLGIQQIQVGDEVGVSGVIDRERPLTVNARVIRNYTVIKSPNL